MYLIEGNVIRENADQKSIRNIRDHINIQLRKAYHFFLNQFDVRSYAIGVYRILGTSTLHPYRLPLRLSTAPLPTYEQYWDLIS
ncbi:hypothetical protein HY491_01750 [Candidatus Woesearchaeota archaeon]|nr:hypothetical protein [Candidatus Woesearchaeota archaeon]